LVVLAVRDVRTGEFWAYRKVQEMVNRHDIEIVRRHAGLEGLGMEQLIKTVRQWKSREGIVVRLNRGTSGQGDIMVKIKTNWWFQAGHDKSKIEGAEEWRNKETARASRMRAEGRTRVQRLAVVGWRAGTSEAAAHECLEDSERGEMVYEKRTGRLRVVMVSYKTQEQAERVLREGIMCDGRRLAVREAYSARTRGSEKHRVATAWAGGI
jgi:hypothetical protein